ncbi:MAG: thiamine diphosphokinase [Peptococcaceae bacterium]|nr:thiamine diphosphokinase [Peptococcaceae bacterium]
MYVIVAGGVLDIEWGKRFLNRPEIRVVVAADAGADGAISSGRIPDIVIGDMDSVTKETLAICESEQVCIVRYPSEKNETDAELALDWAHAHAGQHEVVLIGAGGGRVDHWLGNIGLLLKYADLGRSVRMLDERSQAWVAGLGRHDLSGYQGRTFSVLPLSEAVETSSVGVKYSFDHLTLYRKQTRGVSNAVEDSGPNWVEIHHGVALLAIID